MPSGTVKFYDKNKGFGFVLADGGGNDQFIHVSVLDRCGLRTLTQGQKVTFTSAIDERNGKEAIDTIALA